MAVKSVSDAAELIEALKAAKDGDVLLLEPGTYSGLYLRGFQFENVTIQSKDPTHKAVLTDLMVRESSGLNFSNLEFYVDPAKHIYQFQVLASNDIHFEGLYVHGSLNESPADDKDGLFIRNSSNVSISNSEFEQLWHGIAHLDSSGLLFTGNKFHEIRTDGIRGGGSSDVTITKNFFTDFRPAVGDHPDAIQFWTTHTTASARNITITDNVVVRGDGGNFQGIFLRDQVGDLPFQNVTIANNLVLGGMYNGITIQGGEGVSITGNTVVGFTDMKSWIRVDNSDQVIVSGNAAQDFLFINSTRLIDTANQEVPAATDGGASIWQDWIDVSSDGTGSGGEPALPPPPPPTPPTPSTPAPTPVPEPAPTPTPEVRVGGTAGADRLEVVSGRSTLIEAGGGNDILRGGAGGNVLVGGKGNDTYIVSDHDDVIRELPGGGTDTVASSVNYVLGDHLEVLRLVGGARSGTGNELDNRIVGTEFGDHLAGLAGDDRIQGVGGDDILLGGAGHDQLSGNDGNDKLVGEGGDDKLIGGAGNDVLDGGDGDDWLEGGWGADNMTGGAGADTFIFRPSDVTTKSPDTITDFSSRQGDKIVLSLLDANSRTASDDKFAFVGSQGFTGVAGQLRYDVKNGTATVYGDTNGDGRADFTIVLLNVSSLSASDFIL